MTGSRTTPTRARTPSRSSGSLYLLLAAVLLIGALGVVYLSYAHRDPAPAAASGTPTSPSASSAAATTAPTAGSGIEQAPPGALTFEVLLPPEELTGIGLESGVPVAEDSPQFPVLCDAADWAQTWSAPTGDVGHRYPVAGAGVTEHALGYADATTAEAALARLVADAGSCSSPASGSIQVTDPAAGLGDGAAAFRFDDGGRDGVLAVTRAVVARSGDRLVLVTYTTQQSIGTGNGPGDGGGDDSAGDGAGAESTTRAIAELALARLAGQPQD
ncbi:hypothetical protein GB931_18905 [Modestobacter sp. I12A-02628]|uniref:PknH-like extracellular domain-containing protein n=1 Tax=Goekera deserti TaxID=2497753 RepID=A0A7K3W7W7_9ACTN|nr:hypothetical protein [Goekera deserti]MPQ99948.1 hypothetical protein [Goekera deserti]NDI50107.1 hypothetical protein [Goekera deserti]NEL52416.1 hypothetical protein [Goekera deserti]